jgi:hypothetical protein
LEARSEGQCRKKKQSCADKIDALPSFSADQGLKRASLDVGLVVIREVAWQHEDEAYEDWQRDGYTEQISLSRTFLALLDLQCIRYMVSDGRASGLT